MDDNHRNLVSDDGTEAEKEPVLKVKEMKMKEELYEHVIKVRIPKGGHPVGTNGAVIKRQEYAVRTNADTDFLSRDDLAKYTDSAGWVRFRIALLLLLWVLILGLIGGAIYLVVMDPDRVSPAWSKSWWKQATIYQISVKSFQDSNNDGVGDLNGVQDRLDYIQGIGIQCILLNPMFMSLSGNSFAVTDFTNIDPAVGTLQDFDNLVTAAHARNMTIILDFIPSHTSQEHPWFRDSESQPRYLASPTADYYVWHNGYWDKTLEFNGAVIPGPPNDLKTIQGGRSAWSWSDVRHQYYLHQHSHNTPDLDFRKPDVQLAMEEILRFWLRHGVDGFRFLRVKQLVSSPEAYRNVLASMKNHTTLASETLDIFRRWRRVLDEPLTSNTGKQKVMIVEGEDLESNDLVTAGVNLVFNDDLLKLDSTSTGRQIAHIVETALNRVSVRGVANWALSDYKQHRIASRVGSLELTDGLNMVSMLLPGTVISFYGDELGLKDGSSGAHFRREDPNFLVRGPQLIPMSWTSDRLGGFTNYSVSWLPVQDNFRYTVQFQQKSLHSHLKVFQQLVGLRNNSAIRHGSYRTAIIGESIYSFVRESSNGSGFLVAVDLRKTGRDTRQYSLTSSNLAKTGRRVADVVIGSVDMFKKSDPSALVLANATVNLDGSLLLRPGEAVVLKFLSTV